VLLKVHPSNYRITGYTSAVATRELAGLAREHGLSLIEDLGSGTLIDGGSSGLPPEPTLGEAIAAGVDIVTCSGDKLLGGPQAGLILGREEFVARLAEHPLMRALRPDKLTLAALHATLDLYRRPEEAARAVPVLRMLNQQPAELEARAHRLLGAIGELEGHVEIGEGTAFAGGGSLPEERIASRQLRIRPRTPSADELARRLRMGEPAVIGRVADGALMLDMMTVADEEVAILAKAVRSAMA
jgi:L-seryl-tRNA(Ser) seleniumtransferase